ncbi:MAG: 2,3-bisphosphoglycerate-independent phosphoglycerate mutase [Sphingomonadales bacterium]|nr:2,3-bisphosphoglycerate-independent phosphoglycerate mutase [Sphingomonadales bacterium]
MKKTMLVIMDGWGLGKIPASDAIAAADTPFVDSLYERYPHTTLVTCGEAVGLPEGQMGNSEVGHLNLGAGRVVYQELQRINRAIADGSIFSNAVLLQSIDYALRNNKALHLMGLVSNGGVHSHIDHLKALLRCCAQKGLTNVFIHVFTDGRDCDPKSGLGFIEELEQYLPTQVGTIATVSGRYFAMDRDQRWERIKLAYEALTQGKGAYATTAAAALKDSYARGITDEFIVPTVLINEAKQPIATLQEGDAVICFNFRTDRCREITQVLTQIDLPAFGMQKYSLHYTTLTEYDKTYKNVPVIFETDNLNNTIGEVIAAAGLSQIRIAETEKYPHVSFFFSGGREQPFAREKRIMIPSPKVATYDLQPAMSAHEVTQAILPEIENKTADFICLNYANTDMVGHTGNWEAAKQAASTVDACVARLVPAALKSGYTLFLTSDHGNADYLVNPDGSPNTAHTLNPVPLFIIGNEPPVSVRTGKLGDIAPTILYYMNLPIPQEMTGTILID